MCEYEYSQEGVSRQSAMRARLHSLEELFRRLKEATTPKAQRLFQRLRTNDEVQTLLHPLDENACSDGENAGADKNVPTVQEQERLLADIARGKGSYLYMPLVPLEPSQAGPVALRDGDITELTTRFAINIEVPSAEVTKLLLTTSSTALERYFTYFLENKPMVSMMKSSMPHHMTPAGELLYAACAQLRRLGRHTIIVPMQAVVRSGTMMWRRACSKT